MKDNKQKIFTSLANILRLIQVCLVMGVMQGILVIYFNAVLGVLTTFIFISMVAYTFKLEGKLKTKIQEEIKEEVEILSEIRKDMFAYSTMPVVVLDRFGVIWWNNEAFVDIIGQTEVIDKNIRTIFVDIQIENLPQENETYEKLIDIEDKHFTMICEKVILSNEQKEFNYVIYFIDKTHQKKLESQVKNQKPIVGFLYIDNFEEIMQSIEEVRRPMLMAIIDRKINLWFKNNDVVLCKYERDKFMLFFTKEDLLKMQERKFDILDELRHIQVGNDLPVTISIGIGQNFESLTQSKEDARAAFDLAVGRGGDQAIIKNQDKYTFYGGKTKEVEKSTRVKVRIKAYAFKELLKDADKVYIMGHKNIDMDCLGAAMGVYRAATIMGKKAQIVLDGPTFAIQALYDRIVESLEYRDLFITKDQASHEITKETLLVVVDAHRQSYLESPELLNQAEKVVVFDHHRRSTDFIEDAVLTYIEPFISSTCEMVSEILNYLTDKVKLTQIEADALLAGITIDTKNFVFKAGVRTFEAAAFLRRAGADSTRVRMLFQNDMEIYKIKAGAIKEAEIWREELAISVVYGTHPYANIIAAQVADELLNIKGIEAAFVISTMEDTLLISARALTDMNVQRIMEMLGGGGHKNSAGTQLKGVSIEEAKIQIKNAIENYFEEGE
ncbi:MAG: DHH family phosphoesterase [Cellulosilyticaceae bacterium]